MSDTASVKYDKKFVAFVDVLGFRDLLNKEIENSIENIKLFDEQFRHVIGVLRDQYDDDWFTIRMFSDCICLTAKHTEEALAYLLYELAYIQFYFSVQGIFFRGGLSQGYHYESDIMIYSHGLVKAYDLESSAIYPRILIDDDVVNQYSKSYAYGKVDYIDRDQDGYYYVDYFDWIYEPVLEDDEFFKHHKQAILNQVQRNKKKKNIISKYYWLAKLHNSRFQDHFVQEDWDEEYYHDLFSKCHINMDEVFGILS